MAGHPVLGDRPSSAQPLRILVVDDREENLVAVAAILETLGEELVRARSGAEALRQLLRGEFAVVLLDVEMPGLDGLETARLIRERRTAEPIPIIFLSANADDARARRAYELGAADYVTKPFDPATLRAKVAVFLALTRARLEARQGRDAERLVGELSRTNAELQAATSEGEERRRQLEIVLDSLPDATSVYDRDWRWTYINPVAAARLRETGRDPAALLGRRLWDEFPDLRETILHTESMRALVEGEMVEFEALFPPLGRWFATRIVPAGDRIVSYELDVTARRRAEESVALLADASRVLAASLDYEITLHNLARVAVPRFADYVFVDILTPEGELARVAVAHADPAKEALLRRTSRFTLANANNPVSRTLRTGQSHLIEEMPGLLEMMAHGPEHLELLRTLGARSLVTAPLIARDTVIGTISFAVAESGRRYAAAERALAEEIGRRAAVAVDHARAYAAERQARAAAEQASRAKSDFVATMSHELRTPLAAIIGYEELLADGITGPVTADQLAQLRRIKSSAHHLLGLIDEVLTFSRLEAGREPVHFEEVGVDAVLDDAAVIAEPLAAARGLRFRLERPPEGCTLETDPTRLRQILINLLSNAVKFTDHGEIMLAARADDDEVVFEVRDTGVGIAPDHLDAIWEAFRQVEHPLTRRFGGTGLGLSVTRRLARLLGGEATVSSRVGVGSTFAVRLPVARVAGAVRGTLGNG